VRKGLPLEGWRYDVFGKDALDLVEGKLAFAVVKGRLKMTHVDELHGNMRDANPDAADEAAQAGNTGKPETPEIPKRTTRANERLPAHAQAVAISGGTARGGHFGRAAEACFVSQSTLSAGLARSGNAAGRGAGGTHQAQCALHAAGQCGGGQGAPSCARRRNCRT
jgi:hypothetical protein